ncbi:hypothetical protein lerEdw1_004679 [Lerista edwardsae]|nr:hypothetical protein lerEdw1_004679 [Lerista edwardsae]
MEEQNPTAQPLENRPAGTGEASHDPQPSASTPWTEEREEDHSVGRAPRWEDQWLDFLERVKSQGMLEEEAALWDEAKVAAGSSSSAVQENLPDPRQEADGQQNCLGILWRKPEKPELFSTEPLQPFEASSQQQYWTKIAVQSF